MGPAISVQPDEAEALVRRRVQNGEIADLTQLPAGNRKIPAELLTELLTAGDRKIVHPRGVYLRGAHVVGELNLQDCNSELALTLDQCDLTHAPCIDNAALGAMRFRNGSSLPGLRAEGLRLRGGLDLAGSNVSGTTKLRDSVIGGHLNFAGSTLQAGPESDSIDASHCDVGGSILLRGDVVEDKYQPCTTNGTVRLVGARIAGRLDCTGVDLRSGSDQNQIALNADAAQISGGVLLRGIELMTRLSHPCKIGGTVRLVGSRLGGGLHCYAANIVTSHDSDGRQRAALLVDFAEVSGPVVLRGVVFADKEFSYCEFIGHVRMRDCRISGGFTCSGAHLHHGLDLSGARITGDARINAVQEREQRLESEISGDLDLSGAIITGSLSLGEANITGEKVDLRGCETARLSDGVSSTSLGCWRSVRTLRLQGFRYQDLGVDSTQPTGRRLTDEDTWNADGRVKWLREKTAYHAQPWDQLQQLYRRNGYDQAVRKVGIAKEKSRPKDRMKGGQRAWHKLLGVTIGYGYMPWRAGVSAVLMITALTAIVWFDRENLSYLGDVTPSPGFGPASAAHYAIDTFIPVGDFGVAKDWRAQGWLETVRIFFVGLGWLLVSLFVVGVTRVIRS